MASQSGEQLFAIRDSTYILSEETPPENAYVVHISPGEQPVKEVFQTLRSFGLIFFLDAFLWSAASPT